MWQKLQSEIVYCKLWKVLKNVEVGYCKSVATIKKWDVTVTQDFKFFEVTFIQKINTSPNPHFLRQK